MYKLCTLLSLLYTSVSTAQQLAPIQLDRPDQTECPFTVPKKYIQAEIGLAYENAGRHISSILIPTTLLKYGLTDRLEIRLITELEQIKEFSEKNTGINPVKVGFKTKLIEEKGLIPMISFLGHLELAPVASKHNKTDFYAPSFRFTLQHTLSSKFSLGYNLGAEWDGFSPEPIFLYTLTTGYSISEKLGSFIELYGFLPQKSISDHHIDAGLTYLLNNNMMLDISGGASIDNHSHSYFLSMGYSFRFK